MKKVILGVLAATILLSASATAAFALAPRAGWNFVDADGDGVCDNKASAQCRGYGNGRGCGFRDGRGR